MNYTLKSKNYLIGNIASILRRIAIKLFITNNFTLFHYIVNFIYILTSEIVVTTVITATGPQIYTGVTYSIDKYRDKMYFAIGNNKLHNSWFMVVNYVRSLATSQYTCTICTVPY